MRFLPITFDLLAKIFEVHHLINRAGIIDSQWFAALFSFKRTNDRIVNSELIFFALIRLDLTLSITAAKAG